MKVGSESKLIYFLIPLSYALFCLSISQANLADDSWQYFLYGKNLLETGIFGESPGVPDFRREPAYAVFLFVIISFQKYALPWVPASPEGPFISLVIFTQSFLAGIAALFFSRQISYKNLAILFLGLMLLSPTSLGMNSLIFSETLFVSFSLLAFGFLIRGLRCGGFTYVIVGAFFWMAANLTKDYLSYFNQLALLLFLFSYAAQKKTKRFAQNIRFTPYLLFFATAIFGTSLWQLRGNLAIGDNAFPDRKAIALAGKIVRIDQAPLQEDLIPALYSSLGTNFCISKFGKERCWFYHMLGGDHYGLKTWSEFNRIYGSRKSAWKHMVPAMWQIYQQKPLKQFVGSILELIRIFFIESAPPINSNWKLLNLMPKAWRILGSIILWTLGFVGVLIAIREKLYFNDEFGIVFLIGFCQVVYHFLVMSQVTNLARYGFTILPWYYLLAALGLTSLAGGFLKRRYESWKF